MQCSESCSGTHDHSRGVVCTHAMFMLSDAEGWATHGHAHGCERAGVCTQYAVRARARNAVPGITRVSCVRGACVTLPSQCVSLATKTGTHNDPEKKQLANASTTRRRRAGTGQGRAT